MKNPLIQTSKKLIGSLGLLAAVSSARAQFTFPVYEPFYYTLNANEELGAIGDSGNFWESGNSISSSSAFITTNAALSYPGLLPDPNSTAYGLASKGSGKNRLATFSEQTNTIYASFLIDYLTNNGTAADRIFFALSPNQTATGQPAANAGVWLSPAGNLKISKNSSSTAATNLTSALAPSNTYLVVVRYLVTSSNDEVDLWLDPTSLGNNATIPTPTISTTNKANSRTFYSMAYESPSGAFSNLFYLDEIRVGTNWSQVTSNSCSPGNTYTVGGGGVGCAGGSFSVTLSGSDNGVSYLLYTNGINSGQSMSGTGAAITFASESTTALYTILASNTSSSCVGWMSGSASISVTTPPVITSEPSSATTVVGSEAVYSVGASGLNLTYQWYSNSTALMDGGNISGSATPTLTISPVTSGNAATTANGYWVKISDPCGYTANSTTNALTLDSAANLYWIGGNGNSNWDIATTANFSTTDGGTANTVFHEGDNVTFDDSTSTYFVTLASGALSPSVLTESAGGTYVFNGSGSISGPGSVVMNGGGIFDIIAANTYSGGTTINSGYVLVSNVNYLSLGTGTVTLNGGTLVTEFAGSASVGLSNNVIVTATGGTIEFNGTGSYGSVLFGTLTAPSGSTLTIESPQEPASPTRMRLYNTNITMNGNITLTAPNTSTVFLAPYNSAGTQVYNGVISGNGSIIMRNAGGTGIFNGPNTFTGNMQLSTGYAGAGASSVGSPGSLTSGPFGIGNIVLGTDGEATTGNGAMFASGGPITIGNNVIYTNLATDLFTLYVGGTNNLTLSGTFDLTDPNGGSDAVRLFNITNTALTIISGAMIDDSLGSSQGDSIILTGGGALVLDGTDTFTGSTTVSNTGLLGGSGSLAGPLIVQSNATLEPGVQTVGTTFTVNNSVTFGAGSTATFNVTGTGAGQYDKLVASSITYAGTLNALNPSGTLSIGQTFPIFSVGSHSGAFSAITGSPGTGKAWSFNTNTGVLSIVAGVLPSTNITYSVTGTTVNLSWPPAYLGWTLEGQTNPLSVGISTNWVRIPGTASVIATNFPLSTTPEAVFYRLIYP